MRVLVADDEAAMTRALEALLKREHYSVDVVNNGQDALDYGLAENYDALVLDIMMPKLDGLGVLERINRDRTLKKHPAFIMISAIGQERITEKTA